MQPPVHATAVWQIYRNAADTDQAEAFLRELMPALAAWHGYLYRERTRDGEGLVEIWHPWESGSDNSPLWDEALARIAPPQDEIPEYQRVDTEVVDSSQRPTNAEYDRYAYLVKCYRERAYDQARIRAECPFAIQDVLFNAILAQAGDDLASIARVVGDDPEPFERTAATTRSSLDAKLWNEQAGMYLDYDLRAEAHVAARTWGGLAPLYCGVSPEQRALQVARDDPRVRGQTGRRLGRPVGVCSTVTVRPGPLLARAGLAHDRWVIHLGLRRHGFAAEGGASSGRPSSGSPVTRDSGSTTTRRPARGRAPSPCPGRPPSCSTCYSPIRAKNPSLRAWRKELTMLPNRLGAVVAVVAFGVLAIAAGTSTASHKADAGNVVFLSSQLNAITESEGFRNQIVKGFPGSVDKIDVPLGNTTLLPIGSRRSLTPARVR